MTEKQLVQHAKLGGIVVEIPVCSDEAHCESVRRKYKATGGAVDLVQMMREGFSHGSEKQARWFARAALRRLEEHPKAGQIPAELFSELRAYVKTPARSRVARAVAQSVALGDNAARQRLEQRLTAQPPAPPAPVASDVGQLVQKLSGNDVASLAARQQLERHRARRVGSRPNRGRTVVSSDDHVRRADAVDELELRADELDELDRKLANKGRELEAAQARAADIEDKSRRAAAELDERAANLDSDRKLLEDRAADLEQQRKQLEKREADLEKASKPKGGK